MTLRIAPSTKDTIDWIISYHDGISKDMREYTLIEQNKDKGLYIIDEQNGILLPAQLTGNTLTSIFVLRVIY